MTVSQEPATFQAPRLCDPITLEIIQGAIMAAQREMEALIERTAISAFIREKKDFYTALFDERGVMAVGSMVPIFGDITTPVFEHFPIETMKPGDLYWYNDCYGSYGAVSHSNDQVLLMPVFHGDRLCAFVMSWAHFADIGGMRAGSISPDATEIWQEGIIIPPTKLIDQGVTNEAALAIFHRNSRFPEQSIGDMSALMASVVLGSARVAEIVGGSAPMWCRMRWRSFWTARGGWCGGGWPKRSIMAPTGSPMPSTATATATARFTCALPSSAKRGRRAGPLHL
jgi:N-methylhydantoinase B